MTRSTLGLLLVMGLSACSTTEHFWRFPPGGSEQTFRQDDYACLQESQQHSSSANVNAYGGTAQSGSGSNYVLYQACMRARGYVSVSKKRGAEFEQPEKKPLPVELYNHFARGEVITRACVANGSMSPEDGKIASESGNSLDPQLLAEARRSEAGYVLGAKDCEQSLHYVNVIRQLRQSRGK